MSILRKPIFYTIGLILKIFKIPSKFDDLRIFFPSKMKRMFQKICSMKVN